MTEASTFHPTAERRRKQNGPPAVHGSDSLPLPRLEFGSDTEKDVSDGDGEKEAKRQKSECHYLAFASENARRHSRMPSPNATVTGPLVQVYEFNGTKRLVVALPQSAILVSQEWLTTIAGWRFVYVLNMRNGLPYLSKELFWMALEDISKRAELIAGHSWRDLKEMIDNRTYEPQPQIYSVKTVSVPDPPEVVFTMVPRTQHFFLQRRARTSWIGLTISVQPQMPIEVDCQIQHFP